MQSGRSQISLRRTVEQLASRVLPDDVLAHIFEAYHDLDPQYESETAVAPFISCICLQTLSSRRRPSPEFMEEHFLRLFRVAIICLHVQMPGFKRSHIEYA